jgi:hypothetical protein
MSTAGRESKEAASTTAPLARGLEIGATVLLDCFRIVVGALLVRHFLAHLLHTPQLIGAEGVWHPDTTGPAPGLTSFSHGLRELPTPALRAWFGAGVALAGLLTIGVWPRWCAALLFAMAAITFSAVSPAASPDDAFVRVVALLLALLPIGGSLSLHGPGRRLGSRQRIPGFTFRLLLLLVLGQYIEIGFSGAFPLWTPAGPLPLFIAAAAASVIAPGRVSRCLGILPALIIAWHLHRSGGGDVIGGALLTCHVLLALVPAPPEPSATTSAARSGPAVDALAAIGLVVIAVQSIHWAARGGGLTGIAQATGASLDQAGLAPGIWPASGSARQTKLDLVVEHSGSRQPSSREPGALDDWHMQRMLLLLGASADPAALRSTAARGFVARYCRDNPADLSPGELRIIAGERSKAVAWFACGEGELRAKVVLLDEPEPAPEPMGQILPAVRPVE